MDVFPSFPKNGRLTMAEAIDPVTLKAAPIKLKPLKLGFMTVVDDAEFLIQLTQQKNLPDFVKKGLPNLYQ
jgi:hypothetical protein